MRRAKRVTAQGNAPFERCSAEQLPFEKGTVMALENVAKLFDMSDRVALVTGASS